MTPSPSKEERRTLTDEEFDELKRKRDESINAVVDELCAKQGWDRSKVHFHCSDMSGCYCACPDGPCQHEFSGWREITNENDEPCGGEQFCQRCGMGSIHHTLRFAP